jgi:hypothetical protein
MQKMGCHAAFALIATASFSLPGFAAEPDGPANLITQVESVQITVERSTLSWFPFVERTQKRTTGSYQLLRHIRPRLALGR